MAFNNRGLFGADVRRVFSGKDAVILDAGTGELLATVDSFQAQVSFTNTTFQPLGSPISQEFMTSYACTLTISQCLVEDDKFIQDVFAFFEGGRHAPMWDFASVIEGYDGSQSRYVFRDCVPSGNLDLHNITIGDIVKRSWNLHVNTPPNMQRLLTFARNVRD